MKNELVFLEICLSIVTRWMELCGVVVVGRGWKEFGLKVARSLEATTN
jgi:hypothetical protein